MAAVPQPILNFLDANRRFDGDGMLAAFAPDARVVDDKVVYRGLLDIRGWIEHAIIAAQVVATLRLSAPVGEEQRVVADVNSPFLDSPALLTLRFNIADEHISRLEIGRREQDPQASESSRAGRLP